MSLDLLIKNGTLASATKQWKSDVGIKDGKIVEVADSIQTAATETIDATNLHVLPGVIDSQVHFRDPGLVHKEDLDTGSKAAALGGITTFLEMPNTSPSTTTLASLKVKLNLGAEKSVVNYGFFIGASGENLEEILECVKHDGCPGIKIFLGSSTGDLLLYDKEKLLEILKSTDAPISVHSENELMLRERIDIKKKAKSAHEHPVWRNVETALSSTQMIINLCKEAKRKVHVLHLTTKDEMEFLANNKDFCTVEVTPQHLTLSSPDCYDRLGSYAQMNPPIREEDHRLGLWEGVKNGTADIIGSDHAPHTKEEKDKGYPSSPSGMTGVQTLLPIMLDHVNEGNLTLERLISMVCEKPADHFRMNTKGRIEIGKDADFTLVDLTKEHTFTDEEQASRVGWTPYKGKTVKGFPVQTIVNGITVMKDGKLTGVRAGKPVKHI